MALSTETGVEANTDRLCDPWVMWTQGVRVSAASLPVIANLTCATQRAGAGAVAGGVRDAEVGPGAGGNIRPAPPLPLFLTGVA